MNVGLPGTGIGGLFYLLCAFFMFIHGVVNKIIGNSYQDKWNVVIQQGILSFSMILATVLTNVITAEAIFHRQTIQNIHSKSYISNSHSIIENYPILVPIFLLFFVLVLIQFMRTIIKLFHK